MAILFAFLQRVANILRTILVIFFYMDPKLAPPRQTRTRTSSIHLPSHTHPEMYHRPLPTVRSSSSSSSSSLSAIVNSQKKSPRLTPLLPSAAMNIYPEKGDVPMNLPVDGGSVQDNGPTVFGMPLKYLS